MADEPDDKKKVTFYRLADLEVTEVALVDKPAIGIEFLVLKRLNPDGQPAAAGEEGSTMTNKKKAAGEGADTPEPPFLPAQVFHTLKAMGAALAGFLPKAEDMPEGDELIPAAWAFQAAAEKAEGEETSKEEPMDFRSAWEGMVVADQLWKCFMTVETVVTNIARSDKTPEEKAGLFDKAITDFSDVARELLGLAKAALAAGEGDGDAAADDTSKGESSDDASAGDGEPDKTEKKEEGDAASPDANVIPAEQANLFLTAVNDLVAEVQDLGARLAKVETGGEPPEAPATDGAAGPTNGNTAGGDKPVTMADMQKAIRDAIAQARHPVFKSRIPKQEPPEGELEEGDDKGEEKPTYDPQDRTARQKRLRELNEAALAAQGIPVEK